MKFLHFLRFLCNNHIVKYKKRFTGNYVFLFLVCLIFVFGAYGLVKTPQKTSTAENRNLTQFSHFTIKNFLNGKFQDNFEKALSDQFLMSEEIRVLYGETINNLPTLGLDQIVCKNHYKYLDGVAHTNTIFNCEDYIIPPSMDKDAKQKSLLTAGILEKNIKKYNHVNEVVDSYYYYIELPQTFDFEKDEKTLDLEGTLKENLRGNYTFSSLQYDNYEDYKQYFYKTDHHWNYVGSYQGYRDIANMFGVEPVEPIGVINNHEYFFGTKARDSRNHSFKEEFIVYQFDIPEHDTTVNRKPAKYGNVDNFKNHEYEYEQDFSFYGWVYGGSRGEIIFDFHQPDKDNLLILSNSYGNPIKELVAQHFNKTYAVDLRNYKKELNEDFKLSEYVEKNKIDKVLLVINPIFLYTNNSNQGLEK